MELHDDGARFDRRTLRTKNVGLEALTKRKRDLKKPPIIVKPHYNIQPK